MARYISFLRTDGTPSFGRLSGAMVEDLGAPGQPAFLKDALGGDLSALTASATFARANVQLLPVVPNPGKILCVGLNYYLHAKEAGMAVPERPSIFVRFPGSPRSTIRATGGNRDQSLPSGVSGGR